MNTASSNFDHSAINIPGVTLPDNPAAAEKMLQARVQAAHQSSGPAIPHADVMREMRTRIAQEAARNAA